MDSNEIIREQIFEVIKNQLRDDDPPETRIAYDKLKNKGLMISKQDKCLVNV